MLCKECCSLIKATLRTDFIGTHQMNYLDDVLGKKTQSLSWAAFVAKWNSHQTFHHDIYAIPKKGGITYEEVKESYMKNSELKP
jgi:hypothetical protein